MHLRGENRLVVELIQRKLRVLVFDHVGWGNVRNRRALLGGSVW